MPQSPAKNPSVARAAWAESAEPAPGTWPGTLGRWLDAEWLLFEAFLLVPSVICLLLGDAARAVFFARLALLLGALKWLGWAMLTRVSSVQHRVLMFPAELVTGLAVATLWFYGRNVAGWLVPGSYSLAEYGVFAWLVAAAHVAGTLVCRAGMRRDLEPMPAAMRLRAAVYAPFTLILALTLWSVAKELFPPSQDGWFHAFIGRVFLNDGLFFPHFNGGQPIFYTSGFGAINAVTAALSGLTVVHTQNMQHIVWTVVGLYMLTATVAVVAGRPLAALHSIPPLFLSAYSVHNLPPEVDWTHTAQQVAPALLLAIPQLSLLLPTSSRSAFYTGMAAQSLLGLLVLALNPTCAMFLLLACGGALVINAVRGRGVGDGLLKVGCAYAALTLGAALLVLGADRYYSTLIFNPGSAGYMSGSHYGVAAARAQPRLFAFSVSQAMTTVAAVEPMTLIGPPETRNVPGRHVAWLALALTAAACVLAAGHRRAAPGTGTPAAAAAAAALVGWLAAKYGAVFFAGGMTQQSRDAMLLYNYLFFLARRIELWLLFFAALSAGVSLYLNGRNRPQRGFVLGVAGGTLTVLAIWWLPHARAQLDPQRNYLLPTNMGLAGVITRDDINLVSWMERHLSSDKALIGLTSHPFKLGLTKLLFPIGAAQALPLYGKEYNFTFQVYDPSRPYSYDDYVQHVVTFLDVGWCLRNNIRYFHLPAGDLVPNHGLMRAREAGLLQPVRTVASSGVYAVRPLPWAPRVMPFSASPSSSHQITWQDDTAGVAVGPDPQLVFTLARPEFVHAIRFKYTLTNPEAVFAAAQLFWARAGQAFVEHERTARIRLEPSTTEETLTILVHDTLDRFRFDPDDGPCTFRIRDMELLVKPADRPR